MAWALSFLFPGALSLQGGAGFSYSQDCAQLPQPHPGFPSMPCPGLSTEFSQTSSLAAHPTTASVFHPGT